MLAIIFSAIVLIAITVSVHSLGLALVLRWMMNSRSAPPRRIWPIAWLLIRIALWLVAISLVEIVIWGVFYLWVGCLPDVESAFYFSGVTYSSIGYGDLVLAKPWRMLAPVEGLVGILMSGLSAGVFFAIVSRMYKWYLDHV